MNSTGAPYRLLHLLGFPFLLWLRGIKYIYARFALPQWQRIDEESGLPATAVGAAPVARAGKASGRKAARYGKTASPDLAAPSSYDWRPLVVLTVVAISLSLQEYYGERTYFAKLYPFDPGDPYWTLKGFAWWSGWRFLGYVVIPVVAILLMPGERLRDYYISLRGFFRHMWIYLVLFLLVLPAVLVAAQMESFYRTYPFYKLANRSAFDLWAWQGLYALQFLSLEFFFRGFMLQGLRPSLGSKAIFVMIVPYCMIHFGKPFSETIAAIFAGLILGTLAMRTRSIWGGVLLHVSVALTMDILALDKCPPTETGLPCKGH